LKKRTRRNNNSITPLIPVTQDVVPTTPETQDIVSENENIRRLEEIKEDIPFYNGNQEKP
jgi:hypothetical protein